VIIVAGITRSGLTATMQMLNAGGFPCVGSYPSFEEYEVGETPWGECSGKAVKLVDSQLHIPPDGDYKIIRLHRNQKQQALSFKKFLCALFGEPVEVDLKAIAKSFDKDYAIIDKWASRHKTLHISFEEIVTRPVPSATRIANFVDIPLDVDKMATCIIKRGPNCHPSLLEFAMSR